MAPTAFMDPERPPVPPELADVLGPSARLWDELNAHVADSFGLEPMLVPPSRNYGWDVKYRGGGRTLLTLTPDRGRFTALIVLGTTETEAARELHLGEHVARVFEDARQLHDGRWLFVPVESERDVEDIEALLLVKRRPRGKRAATTPAA